MTAENSALAARFLGVNHFWLATGRGQMREPVSSRALAVEEPSASYLTDAVVLAALQEMLRRVEPEMRGAVAAVLHTWARDGGEDDQIQALCRLVAPSAKQQTAGRAATM